VHIVDATLVRVPLDLVGPLRTSSGTHSARTAVLVAVRLDDGTVGWGENVAPEESFYTGETSSASIRAMRGDLLRGITDRDFDAPSALDASWWGTTEFPMARCAVESAVWDAWCRGRVVALATALGGSPGDVAVGAVVGLHPSADDTVTEAVARVAEGYRHLKLKIAPGRDREVVAAVRDAIGPDVSLSVDANGAYSADDVDLLAGLAEIGVVLVEQPFAPGDLAASARMCATGSVRVGLDESIMTMADLDLALAAGAIDAVNVKPSRLGGLGAAVGILERCRAEGFDAWIGGMLESGIGRAAALALATHPACTLAPDLSASARYFTRDVTEPFVLAEGRLRVPATPGIGREPLPGMIAGVGIETLP